MSAHLEINLPEQIPVMTLPEVAFFPQALLPLHIFEPRYRQMLREVLASNRLFAVAGLDPRRAVAGGPIEPPHKVACVGIIRACQKGDDGTSNLLLQGLARVQIVGIVQDEPYRRIQIKSLASIPGASALENERLRAELSRLLGLKLRLSAKIGREMATFLKSVDDPETFVDIAAFSLCDDPQVKQRLLETLDVHRRLELFNHHLREEIDALRLRRRLQGGLSDDRIDQN
jgi:ATP-dependent Lon protease